MSLRDDHKRLLTEITALQEQYKGKDMPPEVGLQVDTKATEALEIQAKLDADDAREKKLAQLKVIPEPSLPPETKATGEPSSDVAGYVTVGDLVASSDGLKSFLASGSPKGPHTIHMIGALLKKARTNAGLIPLSAKQVKEIKAVPTIGANVIEPMRLSDFARTVEQDQLKLRDILSVGTTTAAAVRYLRTTYTRAAATVAQGAEKPEATMAFVALLAEVRKIAVWMPVDDEQLADLPELSRLINEELLYDLAKHLEELIMYGDGQGQNFDGILVDPDVPTARSEGGDTLIDITRRGITDVRVAGYDPNGIVVDPRDWETILLSKGSDNRYVFAVVQEANAQRLWGVPVIETVAMQDFQGDETEQRHLLVGDFRRGATLWDREQANVQVGWIASQFIENKRTILAELRAAFAVRRPLAFRKYETQAAVVS